MYTCTYPYPCVVLSYHSSGFCALITVCAYTLHPEVQRREGGRGGAGAGGARSCCVPFPPCSAGMVSGMLVYVCPVAHGCQPTTNSKRHTHHPSCRKELRCANTRHRASSYPPEHEPGACPSYRSREALPGSEGGSHLPLLSALALGRGPHLGAQRAHAARAGREQRAHTTCQVRLGLGGCERLLWWGWLRVRRDGEDAIGSEPSREIAVEIAIKAVIEIAPEVTPPASGGGIPPMGLAGRPTRRRRRRRESPLWGCPAAHTHPSLMSF